MEKMNQVLKNELMSVEHNFACYKEKMFKYENSHER